MLLGRFSDVSVPRLCRARTARFLIVSTIKTPLRPTTASCHNGVRCHPNRCRAALWIPVEWCDDTLCKRRAHKKSFHHLNIRCARCHLICSRNCRQNHRRWVKRSKTINRCRVSPFCSVGWSMCWVGSIVHTLLVRLTSHLAN